MRVEEFLAGLKRVKRVGDGRWMACCPAHDDKHPSLSVRDDHGVILLYCFARCTVEEIAAARRVSVGDLFPDENRRFSPRRKGGSRMRAPAVVATPGVEERQSRYVEALLSDDPHVARLGEKRGWTREAIEQLGLGYDERSERVTFPVQVERRLLGHLRYLPAAEDDETKMIADLGVPRVLFPDPATLPTEGWMFVTEGEPDAVLLQSLGLAAVGVPGVQAWRAEWAELLAGRDVAILCDADGPGRELQDRIGRNARRFARRLAVLDIAEIVSGAKDATEAALSLPEAELEGFARRLVQLAEADAVDGGNETDKSNLADLLDEVADFERRYVVVGEAERTALALWVAHTHAFEASEATPYLAVTSAEKRSGKSRLLDTLALLVAKPWRVITPSEAVVVRKIARDTPTLLLDEVDAIYGKRSDKNHEGLRAILDAGNRRGVKVPRCAGPQHDRLEDFDVFCPKALAGIGELPDTIADRSISVRMKRRAPGERVERFRRREVEPIGHALRDRLAVWAQSAIDELTTARPELPLALDDRAAEHWEPLFAIADLAGGEWPDRARRAALALHGREPEDDTVGIRLLADIRDSLGDDEPEVATADLLARLIAIETAPWAEWWADRADGTSVRRGAQMRLAKLLRPFDVRPTDIGPSEARRKGYGRADLSDAFTRYLHPEVAQVAQPQQTSQRQAIDGRADTGSMRDLRNGANPHEQTECTTCATSSAKGGAETRFWLARDGLWRCAEHDPPGLPGEVVEVR